MSHVFKHPNYYKQLNEERKKYEQEASSIKQQAGDNDPDPTRGVGPEPGVKTQAASIKRQAASLKHVPRYVASDYKATSIKRQALTKIPQN
jgi:hypothetical protein